MKNIVRAAALGLLVFLVPHLATAQTELFVGTWKANVAKSRYSPGSAPRNETMKVETVGGGIRVSLDGVNQQGPYHSESTGTFGGADVPVLATPARQAAFSYSFIRIDAHTWEIVIKVNGERRILEHNVVSADGKTTIGTSTTVGSQGARTVQVVTYEKQ